MPSAQRHAFYRSVQSTRGGAQIAPSSSMKSWACWRSPAVRDSNSRSSTSSYTSASSWTCAARAGSQRSAERLERRSDAGIQQRPMAVQGRASCCSVRSPPPSRSARSSAAAASCCSVRRPRRREGRLAIAATRSPPARHHGFCFSVIDDFELCRPVRISHVQGGRALSGPPRGPRGPKWVAALGRHCHGTPEPLLVATSNLTTVTTVTQRDSKCRSITRITFFELLPSPQ